ncbi:MAG: trigger factor, partial [Oscillospiraceae bacterium]|nr:trigger factor [Oscillospiraceae bacterium]
MILKSVTNTEPNIHEMVFEIEPERFDRAVNDVYNREKKNITVPGFRKGKATRKMIEKQYGEGIFYEKALDNVVRSEFNDLVKEAELELVTSPSLELVSLKKEEGAVVKAICTTKPDIQVSDYIGIKAPRTVKPVSEDDVENRIKAILEKQVRMISVEDQPAAMGDEVVIDFEGFKDGVAFPGGKANGQVVTLGSGMFIPGFEEAVAGHSVGEVFDIDVVFPDDYDAKELAGQPAVFKINLHSISKSIIPELDDDLVADISEEADTVEEFRAEVRRTLEEQAEKKADAVFEKYVFDEIIDGVDADIPNCMFESRIDMLVADFERSLMVTHNLRLPAYLQHVGKTLEEFRAEFDLRAEKEVILRL